MDEAITTVEDDTAKNQDVYIEVDLVSLMGQPVKDDGLKEQIGLALVNTIVDRTRSGKYKHPVKGYDEDYKESLPYRVAGKDGTVNMQLSGDMLNSLDVLNVEGQTITIGFNDPLQSKKAFRHHTGDGEGYPKRPFMYISRDEKKEIVSDFKPRLGPSDREISDQENRLELFLGALRNFF